MSDFQATPCNGWLGFELVLRSSERVEITQTVRPEMLQEAGVVQGGLLTALADTAAVYLLWPDLGENRSMTGTSVSMQFLSAAILDAEPLQAIALPLRVGRRVAVCESVIYQGTRMIAKGTFTFLLGTK
ncbi:PaaI family thioesterase [bacterium]|nr:PaaI family thioesterase [bacterium]